MPRVRVKDSFRADVRAQIAWLRCHHDATWIEGLREGMREARSLLASFPAAGPTMDVRPEGTLRKLVLRRLPFNVWYLHVGNEVWLLRLFHHRQDR